MAVRIQLDKSHAHFTNLDFITGKVILSLSIDTPISSVVVKLEGESRTRLAAPKYPHNERSEKRRTEFEVHKLLYKVVTVFPTSDIQERAAPNAYYALSAGTYEYPFHFKFPFNNDCLNNNNMVKNLNMTGLRLDIARDNCKHVKKTLPPSVSGFPGEAEIKYYVKATVGRPQFYKENYRAFADIKFLPIEPPREKDVGNESFARRQQQFSKAVLIPERKNRFRKTGPPHFVDIGEEPPRFSVDARLPSPPVITCNEPLPLRILVTKLSASSETIYLQMLQIELIGHTHVRAHDLSRSESGSWVILSKSSMNMAIGDGKDPVGTVWKVDPRIWQNLPLPNSVAPSFETCNISRTYELEIRIGLGHGKPGSIKPELIVLPLRMAVQVFSGIAPPQALLNAMAAAAAGKPNVPERPAVPPRPPQLFQGLNPTYTSPVPGPYEDAPPSYEDAMAEALGPVDGPRREYNPPDVASRSMSWSGADTRAPTHTSKDNDRLFPDSERENASTESFDPYSITPLGSPAGPYFLGTQQPPSEQEENGPGQESRRSDLQPEHPQRGKTPSRGIPTRKPVPGDARSDSGVLPNH